MPLAFSIFCRKENSFVVSKYIQENFSSDYYFNDNYNENRRCDHYYEFWLFLNYIHTKNNDSMKIYKRILESYNNEAFSNSYDMHTNEFEVRATAFGGICAYFINDDSVLINASNYLIRVFDYNNENSKFHFIFDRNFNPVLFNKKQLEKLYFFYNEQVTPLYYSFYLASICLALTFLISREIQYIKYAEKYYNCLLLSDSVKYNSYSGKLGIASALLSNITRNQYYRKNANDIKNYISITQSDMKNIKNNIINIDRTSEFSISIYIIESLLSSRIYLKGNPRWIR